MIARKNRPARAKVDRTRMISVPVSRLRKRIAGFWGHRRLQKKLVQSGVKFRSRARHDNISKALEVGVARTLASLLNRSPSKYVVRKSLEMEGGRILEVMDDQKKIPPNHRLVVLTHTLSLVENSKNRIQTEVYLLERRR